MSRVPARLPLSAEAALRRRCQRILADQRRRGRADGVPLHYGLAELVDRARGANVCTYCRSPLHFGILRFDHQTPTARGGAHALGNLVVCCDRCNRLKGKLDASEFAELLAFLARLHPAAAEDLIRRLLAGGRRYRR